MPDVIEATAREVGPEDDGGFDYMLPPSSPQTDLGRLPAIVEAPLTGELPTVPAGGELQTLAQLARTFAYADLVPKALKERPADCLLVLMTARDLGLSITVAFRELHPIDGRVTASPKLKLAIVRQRGLGRVWPAPDNGAAGATWFAVRADDPTGFTYSSTFTIDEAKAANLTGKDNWKHYPARMCSWRALGYLLDDAFGEVGTGLYSADELGALTDEEGRPVIDVSEVAPLDGMRSPAQERAEERAAEAEAPADSEALWLLQTRLHALPEDQRAAWREQKMKQARLQGRPTHELRASDLRLAQSIVGGLESAARRGGHDQESAIADVTRLVSMKLIGWLTASPPEGEEPSPDPEPEPEPEPEDYDLPGDERDPVADLVADLEQSVASARAAAADVEAHRAAVEEPAPKAGPTAAQVAALTAQIAVTVDNMRVTDVRKDLADYQADTSGPAPEVRARLVHLMVQNHLEGEEPF